MVLKVEIQGLDFEDKYYMPIDSFTKKIFQVKHFPTPLHSSSQEIYQSRFDFMFA